MSAHTVAEVEDVYAKLAKEREDNLAPFGVSLPALRGPSGFNGLALQLALLRIRYRELVSKEELSSFVRQFRPEAASDQQARHLVAKGWDVRCSGKSKDRFDGKLVPSGFHVLASVEHPASRFMAARVKRLGRMAATDWAGLQEAYGHKCAACGEHSRGKLEKGHKDPALTMDLVNVIPMCGECNNWAGNRFVFDDKGRISALANSTLVMASSANVRYQIYLDLQATFGKGKRQAG
jgi:hypothetical protein